MANDVETRVQFYNLTDSDLSLVESWHRQTDQHDGNPRYMFEEWRNLETVDEDWIVNNIGCSDVEINDFNKTTATLWVQSYTVYPHQLFAHMSKKLFLQSSKAYFSIKSTDDMSEFFAMLVYHNGQVVLSKEYDGCDVEDKKSVWDEFDRMIQDFRLPQ